MKAFSMSDEMSGVIETGSLGLAGTLAKNCLSMELDDIASDLRDLYAATDTFTNNRIPCRKCANCCRHRIIQAYAVEIAYLLSEPAHYSAGSNNRAGFSCPALSDNDACDWYDKRPLACRVFQPWATWTPGKGCANYPYNRTSSGQLHTMLAKLTRINDMFVVRTGLHRDLDFDYFGHWSIADWFTEPASAESDPDLIWSM